MKHILRTALIAFLALFSASPALSQSSIFDGMLNGFTTPMRIVGSKANTSVDIGIDTIRYIRHGENNGVVSFDAHANLQIPFAIDGQESTRIKFRGEHLTLAGNSDEQAVLTLEANLPRITIQADKIWLRIDEGSVLLGCDGIEGIRLKGAFEFSDSFIKSTTEGATVEARFDINVSDWDDLMFEVRFNTPFKVDGCGDFEFEVIDAVVDLSTQSNASGFTFPPGYDTGFLRGDENLWTGFALRKLKISPPEELRELGVGNSDDTSSDRRFTYTISNMLIDSSGLTGSFEASRAPGSHPNPNNALNVSINRVGVSIMQNYIVGGIIEGQADVPFLKDKNTNTPLSLAIGGALQYDRSSNKITYHISGTMVDNRTFGVPLSDNASVTLARGCSFTVGNVGGQFGATLLLNGMLNIGEETADKLNIQGIRFEGLRFSTYSPHFQWSYFGLEGNPGMNFGGFSISLTKLGLQNQQVDNTAALNIGVMLALMEGSMSIAAAADVTVIASYENNEWSYVDTDINAIELDMDFSVFRFKGSLEFFNQDGIYGNGFKGDIGMELTLKTFNLNVGADIRFGNTNYGSNDYYKYWYVKATGDLPGKVILFPPAVILKSITGGAYQRMRPEFAGLTNITESPVYIPHRNTSFGFMAGIGIYFVEEKLISANAMLEMSFNSHFGLRHVRLNGIASVLSDRPPAERKGLANAALQAYYDVENKIFSTNVEVDVNFFELIRGEGYVSIYTSPDTWFCHIGTMDKPNRLRFLDLVRVQSYFMLGAIPAQMPPLSPRVLSLFGSQASSNAPQQSDNILQGKGFAFGISLSADCGFGQRRGFVFAFIEVEGGTDALINFSHHTCDNNISVNWRGSGRAYVYVNGEAGVRVRKKKFHILQLSAAAALSAEFPAPYYLSGQIAFRFKVLFIKGRVRAGYSAGKQCRYQQPVMDIEVETIDNDNADTGQS